jgi:hypothetical protein
MEGPTAHPRLEREEREWQEREKSEQLKNRQRELEYERKERNQQRELEREREKRRGMQREAQKRTEGERLELEAQLKQKQLEGVWVRGSEEGSEDELILPEPDYMELGALKHIAQEHPSQALLQAWVWLSNVVTARLPKVAVFKDVEVVLPISSIVPAQIAAVVEELNNLRDKVAHGQHTPTPGEAIAYIESCQQMARIVHSAYPRKFGAYHVERSDR